MMSVILFIGIALVIAYNFTNGFQDAGDIIATAIASHAMPPSAAIFVVTLFTFIGPMTGGIAVANTIGQFVVMAGQPHGVAEKVVLAALASGATYNVLSYIFGLPNSSTSSLASGLIGSALVALGAEHIHWGFAAVWSGHITGFMAIVIGVFFSPLVGFLMGIAMIKLMKLLLCRLTVKAEVLLMASQYLSVAWLAYGHGTNDAQKGMGMLAMLLLAMGIYPSLTIPLWVVLLCSLSIAVGTMFGGWRIIRTIGFGLYKIRLIHSVTDQVSSSAVIWASSMLGIPVSATQVVTATLMGVGAGERPRHVKWGTAFAILGGWLLNIPFCIMCGACYYALLKVMLP